MTSTMSSRWIALVAAAASASSCASAAESRIGASEQNVVGTGTGLLGEYFDNVDFTAPVAQRIDRAVLFNWDTQAPISTMALDNYSVRWTGQVEPLSTGDYTFYVSSDDGVRLWVGGQLIIDGWSAHPMTETSGTIALTAGQRTDIRLEYYNGWGLAGVQLSWSAPGLIKMPIPMTSLYPPALAVPGSAQSAPPPQAPPPAAPPPPAPSPSTSGAQQRPAYNTGTGFFVVGNKLYDANGNEFRMRGLNHLHWDAPGVGIPKTGANTERWVIDLNQSSATNIGLMQKSINNKMVPIAGDWDGTCNESTATLSSIVNAWVATASTWKAVEKDVLINIANEWGPSGTAWRDAYISAVAQIRGAGINATLVIDAGGCGQDNADLAQYAAAVFNSDPQKNIVFDQHIYGNWIAGGGPSWQTDLNAGLDALAATGLPFIVGEFGPGRNIGPSPTMMTPGQIIQAAEARGMGWLAWAWDDPAGEWATPTDDWFALSFTGDYQSSADLTTFGKDVVENPTYGFKALARPASIF